MTFVAPRTSDVGALLALGLTAVVAGGVFVGARSAPADRPAAVAPRREPAPGSASAELAPRQAPTSVANVASASDAPAVALACVDAERALLDAACPAPEREVALRALVRMDPPRASVAIARVLESEVDGPLAAASLRAVSTRGEATRLALLALLALERTRDAEVALAAGEVLDAAIAEDAAAGASAGPSFPGAGSAGTSVGNVACIDAAGPDATHVAGVGARDSAGASADLLRTGHDDRLLVVLEAAPLVEARVVAARALASEGPGGHARRALRRSLDVDPSPLVRAEVLAALVTSGEPDATRLVVAVLRRDPATRASAARLLAGLLGEEADRALAEAFLAEAPGEACLALARALAARRPLPPLLLETALSASPRAEAATQALARSSRHASALRDVAARSAHEGARALAVTALGRTGAIDRATLESLAATDPSLRVREAARAALAAPDGAPPAKPEGSAG